MYLWKMFGEESVLGNEGLYRTHIRCCMWIQILLQKCDGKKCENLQNF